MKREKFLERVISQEQISVGLTSIDNNFWWRETNGCD